MAENTQVTQPEKAKIIKLNIGGTLFYTTKSTLLGRGECYFSGLLNERFTPLLDENGAYFIDRNGKYFAPILEFLRTGHFRIPPKLEFDALREECFFYGIQDLIDYFSEDDTKNDAKEETAPPLYLRYDGFYHGNNFAVTFSQKNLQLIAAIGPTAREDLAVFHATERVPNLWQVAPLYNQYAKFIETSIKRGRYWIEGPNLKLMLSQQATSLNLCRAAGDNLYIMFENQLNWAKLTFSKWDIRKTSP
eukprot:TRINITY_DN3129_c0_g1_i3.p1 TRINITY_DN3129_c0_g1~~TRINITY_DN3129_c0_g1_i3.p1  ORF type:complete len:269 (-),score=59.43 TRINITY_DN3129_c0_g1_i3:90-833(-)